MDFKDYAVAGGLGAVQGYFGQKSKENEAAKLAKEEERRAQILYQKEVLKAKINHKYKMEEKEQDHKYDMELAGVKQKKEYDPQKDIDFLETEYAKYLSGRDEFDTSPIKARETFYAESFPSRFKRAFPDASDETGVVDPFDVVGSNIEFPSTVKPGANTDKEKPVREPVISGEDFLEPRPISFGDDQTEELPAIKDITADKVKKKLDTLEEKAENTEAEEIVKKLKGAVNTNKAEETIVELDKEFDELMGDIKGTGFEKTKETWKQVVKDWKELIKSLTNN